MDRRSHLLVHDFGPDRRCTLCGISAVEYYSQPGNNPPPQQPVKAATMSNLPPIPMFGTSKPVKPAWFEVRPTAWTDSSHFRRRSIGIDVHKVIFADHRSDYGGLLLTVSLWFWYFTWCIVCWKVRPHYMSRRTWLKQINPQPTQQALAEAEAADMDQVSNNVRSYFANSPPNSMTKELAEIEEDAEDTLQKLDAAVTRRIREDRIMEAMQPPEDTDTSP